MKKIKILVTGTETLRGGTDTYLRPVFSHCHPTVYEFHRTATKEALSTNSNDDGITKHVFPLTYSLVSLLPCAVELRRLIQRERFDLLHLNTVRSGFLGCLAATGLPVAIVYTPHAWRFEQKKTLLKPLWFAFDRYICSRANMVTTISQREKNIGLAKGLVTRDKVETIYAQLDMQELKNIDLAQMQVEKHCLGIPDNACVIGNTGTMESRKDPLTFVRTAAKIRATIPNAYFLWVGDGELRAQASELAYQSGIGDRLVITGWRPRNQTLVLLHLMDVFLFTSRIEGVPLSILEAQATRRPVVSSAFLGVEELINHGRTGYVFSPGNEEEASRCVLELLQDSNKTSEMVEAAERQVLERHGNPQRMAKQYEKIYEKALQLAGALSRYLFWKQA